MASPRHTSSRRQGKRRTLHLHVYSHCPDPAAPRVPYHSQERVSTVSPHPVPPPTTRGPRVIGCAKGLDSPTPGRPAHHVGPVPGTSETGTPRPKHPAVALEETERPSPMSPRITRGRTVGRTGECGRGRAVQAPSPTKSGGTSCQDGRHTTGRCPCRGDSSDPFPDRPDW